jgi:hypothetical protein
MNFYLSIPVLFLRFWFLEAPFRLIKYFLSLNHAILQILSVPILLRTFFKPLKNEYRKGLVLFSLVFGIIVKSSLLFIDLIVFGFIILLEVVFLAAFILWPFLTFYILIL